MEERRPDLSRRPASFNPEAATFSPTVAKAAPPVRATEPTPPASPLHRSGVPDKLEVFMPLDDLQDLLRGETKYNTIRLSKTNLTEHCIALTQDRQDPTHNVAASMDSINIAMPYNPPSLFSTQRLEPSIRVPEVDELSTNLGLPGTVRRNKTDEDDLLLYGQSPRSFKGYAKDSLHGKLIGRALDKPLTANTLAQYLNGQTDPDYPAAAALGNLHDGFATPLEREPGEDPPRRIVQPPPGFGGERPREIRVEDRSAASFAILESPFVPTGPAALGRLRRFSDLQSANPLPQYQVPQYDRTRRPSIKRHARPRAPTRTRRTDQGPEPSAADIYPDDALWMSPRRAPYTPEPMGAFPAYAPSAVRVPAFSIAQDTTSWPTPAEVYAQKTKQSPPQPSAFTQTTTTTTTSTTDAPFDLFANHSYPSTADILDADADVEVLICMIPDLFDLGLHGALPDERPLTLGHADGTRYGVGLHGIGLGDAWRGPDLGRSDASKARW
ncbi:uncharacterized protein SETTUDRAFT_103674 [Exserohilum turcica Et28A]|uniref:Uncharacterized protein n=1 Tax=Exserohilum turcicum (strain 28A) TaxID=671987 RepID=R0KN48_EXST2|nr:uncharacterized protein SETTUDRAFT_103674 [Exserohilum turcica Et28A]EOA90504.1 hypothetical protein SETTUDRAFT_103674 [Exserohilum turcica Et28A]